MGGGSYLESRIIFCGNEFLRRKFGIVSVGTKSGGLRSRAMIEALEFTEKEEELCS